MRTTSPHPLLIGLGCAFALVTASVSARAQCLTGGDLLICEDPLTGSSPQASVVGGSLLGGGGFRVDAKGDHVTFDLGADATEATVRFTLSNVSAANLDQDTHLVLLATDTPELKNPDPKRVLELKIWGGAVDPNALGTTILGAGDGTQEAKKSAGKPGWDANTTYAIDVSWDNASQQLRLVRSGQTLLDFKTGDVIPGANNPPVDLRFRYVHLAMPFLANNAFWPVVKSVYGMASISATLPGMDGGSGGASGSGGMDAGSSDAAGSGGAAGGGASNSGGAGATADASAGGPTGGAGGSTAPGGSAEEADSGCGCRSVGTRDAPGLWLVSLAGLAWARHRARAKRAERSE